MSIFKFAQKAVIFDKEMEHLLVSKYLTSKYNPQKLENKFCLPGGTMSFGEELDVSFIKIVKEETGVTVAPGAPCYLWSWHYLKDNEPKQIVGVVRICFYEQGQIAQPQVGVETTLDIARWVKINSIKVSDFVIDEQPVIKELPKYIKAIKEGLL